MEAPLRIARLLCWAPLLAGCGQVGISAAPDEKTRNTQFQCVDTRDGETFAYHGSTIRDVFVSLSGEVCGTVTDDSGRDRRFCSAAEAYLKCEAEVQ